MDLEEKYSDFVKYSPPMSVEALGWSNEEAQQKRFQVISEIGIKTNDSVLDVGCGYGDFSLYAGEEYYGIDIRKEAIETAKKKYKFEKFFQGDIFGTIQNFDWVVASGIFCFPQDNWEEYVYNTLSKMYEKCNKGVAVNFLSGIHYNSGKTLAEIEEYELKHAFPEDVIRLLRDITNNFTIRHDYGFNDFTLYLYK